MASKRILTDKEQIKEIQKFNADNETLMVLGKDRIKKEFQVIYKFSDVVETIEAYTKEEAQKEADRRLNDGNEEEDPTKDTYCYEIEVEEDKE